MDRHRRMKYYAVAYAKYCVSNRSVFLTPQVRIVVVRSRFEFTGSAVGAGCSFAVITLFSYTTSKLKQLKQFSLYVPKLHSVM